MSHMKIKTKPEKKNTVNSVIWGIVFCGCLTVGLCTVAAGIVAAGLIKEEYSEYLCILALFISSFTGSMTVKGRGEPGSAWLYLAFGLIYTVVLGLNGLLMFHRTAENAAMIITSIMAGSIISFLLMTRRGKERRRRSAARYR